ncbi:hypothetical protein ACXM2N_04105 [Corynebacterium sp. ZY180755]
MPTPAEVAAKTTASTAEKSATASDTFDRGYVEKLRKEVAGYRSKLKELEPIAAECRKQQDASKSELEAAQAKAAAEAMRATVATQAGVPVELLPDSADEATLIHALKR